MLCVIYKQDNGQVAVLSPSIETLYMLGGGMDSLMKIAVKDVPAPKKIWDVPTGQFEVDDESGEEYEVMTYRIKTYPFKIVDSSDLPQDIPQEAWIVDDADLTDGIGGESCEFCKEDLEVLNVAD